MHKQKRNPPIPYDNSMVVSVDKANESEIKGDRGFVPADLGKKSPELDTLIIENLT